MFDDGLAPPEGGEPPEMVVAEIDGVVLRRQRQKALMEARIAVAYTGRRVVSPTARHRKQVVTGKVMVAGLGRGLGRPGHLRLAQPLRPGAPGPARSGVGGRSGVDPGARAQLVRGRCIPARPLPPERQAPAGGRRSPPGQSVDRVDARPDHLPEIVSLTDPRDLPTMRRRFGHFGRKRRDGWTTTGRPPRGRRPGGRATGRPPRPVDAGPAPGRALDRRLAPGRCRHRRPRRPLRPRHPGRRAGRGRPHTPPDVPAGAGDDLGVRHVHERPGHRL
jgi:hypothetical protein